MKTIKEIAYEMFSKRHITPFWIVVPPKSTNASTLKDAVTYRYKEYLEKEKESAEQAILEYKKRKEKVLYEIEKMNKDDIDTLLKILQEEIDDNKQILEKIIKERGEYIEYLKNILETIKNEEPKNDIMEEFKNYIIETFPSHIMIENQTIKRLKIEYKAMIDPNIKTPEEIRERILTKKKLLSSDVSLIEENIENYKDKVHIIENKLSKLS